MKRTDITELFPDAPKEAVEKLMSINGNDVNAAKAELDTLRSQLEAAKNNGGDELKKAQDTIAQLTSELEGMKTKENLRIMREKVAGEKNVPASLLTGDSEEDCAKQADSILAFAKSGNYPAIKDGGEVNKPTERTTRDAFADWAKDAL